MMNVLCFFMNIFHVLKILLKSTSKMLDSITFGFFGIFWLFIFCTYTRYSKLTIGEYMDRIKLFGVGQFLFGIIVLICAISFLIATLIFVFNATKYDLLKYTVKETNGKKKISIKLINDLEENLHRIRKIKVPNIDVDVNNKKIRIDSCTNKLIIGDDVCISLKAIKGFSC